MILSSVVDASTKYECNRYVNGKYGGYIKIVADSKKEAEIKLIKNINMI